MSKIDKLNTFNSCIILAFACATVKIHHFLVPRLRSSTLSLTLALPFSHPARTPRDTHTHAHCSEIFVHSTNEALFAAGMEWNLPRREKKRRSNWQTQKFPSTRTVLWCVLIFIVLGVYASYTRTQWHSPHASTLFMVCHSVLEMISNRLSQSTSFASATNRMNGMGTSMAKVCKLWAGGGGAVSGGWQETFYDIDFSLVWW